MVTVRCPMVSNFTREILKKVARDNHIYCYDYQGNNIYLYATPVDSTIYFMESGFVDDGYSIVDEQQLIKTVIEVAQ